MIASSPLTTQLLGLGIAASLTVFGLVLVPTPVALWVSFALIAAALVAIGVTLFAHFRLRRQVRRALALLASDLRQGNFDLQASEARA